MVPISGFIIICLLLTLGYFVGFLTFLTDHEENKCEMTFMFEYPQFVRVSVEADKYYKNYGLYAYSEGRFTQKVRQMQFDGIPVLFIPGNAGSFKQVRSFASVALRKALDSRPGFQFDFFTIDLNNELSGLNGALLNKQMQYVNYSVERILELYKDRKYPPKSVVLIGHSMGGIIARGLLATLPQNSTLLPLIITLAAPHLRPPISIDNYIVEYYKEMEKMNVLPSNSTIIAISGGYNDFLISPSITLAKNFENLHIATTSIPLVWLPADHLCILWCKQLVLAVTRGFFDLVDPYTKRITLNTEAHKRVFQHHMIRHSGTKSFKFHEYKLPVTFNKNGCQWIENLQTQYSISLLNGTKQVQWHMIRLLDEPTHESLAVLALNLKVSEWIFACPAIHEQGQSRICWDGIHLSHLSEIAPSTKYKRRILKLNLHELKKNYSEMTHVVIRVFPTNEPIVLHMDIHKPEDRKIEVALPRWWSVSRQSVIVETSEKVLSYELVLPQLQHIIQSYKLYVEPIRCSNNIHHATASLKVPWANHDIHKYFTEDDRNPLDVRLYNSKPRGLNNFSSTISLTLDPACTYSISIRNSFTGMLGQMARTYSSLLIANVVAVVLLGFKNQLVSINETGTCSVFFNAIKYGVKPYYILTLVKVASRLSSWKGFLHILPLPDWQIIADDGSDFFVLPLLLYMCSVGIVWLTALGIGFALVFCESTFHKGATKFLARTISGAIKISDWLIGGIHKLPCIVAVLLILLSVSTCGALALCLGCGFYFLKLTQMSQDYVEGIATRIVKYFALKLKRRVVPQRTNENVNSSQSSISGSDLSDRTLSRVEDEQSSDNEIAENESEIKDEEENKNSNVAHKQTGNSEVHSSSFNTEKDKSDIDAEQEKKESNTSSESTSNDVTTNSTNQIAQINENTQEDDQNNTEAIVRKEPGEHSSIFFHFSIFLLWSIVAGLNVPSVLTWAHNFKYSTVLQPDPSFLPGFILSSCAILLWQMDLPKPNVSYYVQVGYIFNFLAAVSLIYAPISVYRLEYIITTAIVLITLHQFFAPKRSDIIEESTESELPHSFDPLALLHKIKAKWE